jgi:pimeloyl-ACP methyl ester carboxylesterase
MTYHDSLYPSHKPSDYHAYRAGVAAMLHEPGRMEALMAMAALSKSDTAQLIAPLPKPALLIGGSRDIDFPNPTTEFESLAATMAIRSVVVDGVGHYPQAEAPDITAAAILDFLRALD